MKKTIILSILALAFALQMLLKLICLYLVMQSSLQVLQTSQNTEVVQTMVLDKAGHGNGNYQELLLTYSSTLDSGIDVSGTLQMNVTRKEIVKVTKQETVMLLILTLLLSQVVSVL